MANPEHVALVRKGADAVAEWRQAHPDERLDLSEADLKSAGGITEGGAENRGQGQVL